VNVVGETVVTAAVFRGTPAYTAEATKGKPAVAVAKEVLNVNAVPAVTLAGLLVRVGIVAVVS
jgi:hypothetical protein